MFYRVHILGRRFLKAPKGYTPEEYYGDDYVRVGQAKTLAGAQAIMERKTKTKVYGYISEPIPYEAGGGRRLWVGIGKDRVGHIDESIH